MIDPNKPNKPISKYFVWSQALWLPTWRKFGTQADGFCLQVERNLTMLFEKLDLVREYFDSPLHVHVSWRPAKYNKEIGGAASSAHVASAPGEAACDFDVVGISCGDAIKKILADGKLDIWGMRMEDNGLDPPWIHLDTKKVVVSRYFKP